MSSDFTWVLQLLESLKSQIKNGFRLLYVSLVACKVGGTSTKPLSILLKKFRLNDTSPEFTEFKKKEIQSKQVEKEGELSTVLQDYIGLRSKTKGQREKKYKAAGHYLELLADNY